MANRFEFLVPDIAGAVHQGRAQVRQQQREQLADQELRAQLERGNQFRQLAGQAYGAPTPSARQPFIAQAAAADPQGAMMLERQLGSNDERKQQRLGVMARALQRVPPDRMDVRAQLYTQMVPELRALGMNPPDAYTPEMDEMAKAYYAMFAPDEATERGVRSELMQWIDDYRRTNPNASVEDATKAYTQARTRRGGIASYDAGIELSEDGSPMPREKPPAGYRWGARGNLEAIPGGPADKPPDAGAPDRSKPMPVGALKILQDARDALSVATGIDTALGRIHNQLARGELKLGPMENLISRGRNVSGVSSENSRRFEMMMSTLEKLRNDSLRLNKGVQTEGDAQRAWNELMANVNDERNVTAQLERIMEINGRAAQLQQENMDAVRENYGRSEAPTSSAEPPATMPQPPAGSRGNDGWSIVEE